MEGAAQLVSTLGKLVGEEYRQLRGVGGQVAELRDELATMNAILRMQSEADAGAVDHFIREWMKQVRELAYDTEDCVHLYIFRIRCGLRDLGFILWSKRLLTTLFSRRQLAGEIQALRARAVAISERHARYGVSREALSCSASSSLAPTPAVSSASVHALRPASNDPDQFVGMRDQAKILADKVKDNKEGDMKLKVFSIVGFGGLGKTTLAMEVCRLLEVDFQRQAQVSVSQTFTGSKDLEALLRRVLQQIVKVKVNNEKGIKEEDSRSLDKIDEMGLDTLTNTIKERLKDKRYLIVVDDVWTIAAWDAIQSRLPENDCGSRVLVTTRIGTVAKACSHGSVSGGYIYEIKPLSLEDSKMLFLSRAFGSKDASYPKELEDEIGKILKKCAGLPMAIVSIASLFSGYKSSESIYMWERICRSIGSQMESNPTLEGMRQIVTLSYNHLPHHLKGCMMYLSIFPEDYIISKDRLLCRWIAEGLVEEKRGLTLLEVAESYFAELVSRSMIALSADGIITSGNKGTCRVHDMLLEVMVSKSLEANFVSLIGGQYEGMSYDRIRRLTIHGGGQGRKKSSSKKKAAGRRGIEGTDVQHIRSLSMFDPEGHKLLDRLGEFALLRVLDLEDCKGLEKKHMVAICRMYLLRFLGLKGTDIKELPQEVSNLEHLQTLDVSYTLLTGLPESVTKLRKVERLMFSNKLPGTWKIMWKAPSGLSEMKALREVSNVVIDSVQVAQEIGDLEQLQGILVYVDGNSEQKEEVRGALACSLGKTYSLSSLDVGDIIDDDHTLNYLIDPPSPPQLLRYLRLSGVIARLPDWVGALTYLVEFVISSTKLADDKLLGVLCKAPNLQIVQFDYSFYTDHQLVARTAHNFPALKVMRVATPDEWPKVFRFEEGSMTRLENLEVNFGGYREKSVVGIEHLTSLKKVRLSGQKGNPALNLALDQIMAVSDSRPEANRFTVAAQYW